MAKVWRRAYLPQEAGQFSRLGDVHLQRGGALKDAEDVAPSHKLGLDDARIHVFVGVGEQVELPAIPLKLLAALGPPRALEEGLTQRGLPVDPSRADKGVHDSRSQA
jgi:hypothetical protein